MNVIEYHDGNILRGVEMILGVRSNRAEFNRVRFSEGFNVVIADITKDSTQKDSRNGLGKTTLLNIIHFCLGGKEQPKMGLRTPELHDWVFTVDFLIRGEQITVSRSGDMTGDLLTDANDEWFIENVTELDDLSPQKNSIKFGNEPKMSRRKIVDWTSVLGWAMYDLPVKSAATFRNLISYDIRRNQFREAVRESPAPIHKGHTDQ